MSCLEPTGAARITTLSSSSYRMPMCALFAGWAIGHGARWSLWTLTGFNMLWLVAVVVAPYAYIRDSTLRGGWELIGYAAFFGGPGLVFGLTSLGLVLRILLNPSCFQLFQ